MGKICSSDGNFLGYGSNTGASYWLICYLCDGPLKFLDNYAAGLNIVSELFFESLLIPLLNLISLDYTEVSGAN